MTEAPHIPMSATLKGIRKSAGYSADQLAEQYGLKSEQVIYGFEAGRYQSQHLV